MEGRWASFRGSDQLVSQGTEACGDHTPDQLAFIFNPQDVAIAPQPTAGEKWLQTVHGLFKAAFQYQVIAPLKRTHVQCAVTGQALHDLIGQLLPGRQD